MLKITKLILVAVLALSMALAGPLTAFARPDPSAIDTPVFLHPLDLTEQLQMAASDSGYNGAREVTALAVCPGAFYFIAAVDNDGKPFIMESNGSDVTDFFPATIADGLTHINDMAVVFTGDSGPYVGSELLNTNTPALAIVGDKAGVATMRIVDINLNSIDIDLSASGITSATSVAGLWFQPGLPIGMTLGDSGFAMLDWSDGLTVSDTAPMNTAANDVEGWMYGFITGTHDGNILATGLGGEQSYPLPSGAGDVQSVGYDFADRNDSLLAATIGDSGLARLFSMTDPSAITEANLPQTMTANAKVSSGMDAVLMGGTGGGAAHLYRWRPAAGEFINSDYMLSGMSALSDIYCHYGTIALQDEKLRPLTDALTNAFAGVKSQGAIPAGDPMWMIGGSGTTTLVTVYSALLSDLTPVTAGEGTTATCDAGGASVDIPAGAVTSDYTVSVEKVASGTPAVPGGLSLLGASYEFNCYDTNGTPITTFSQPVTITISYDPAALNGMSEDSLIIYYFDTADSTWKAVTPCVVDKVNHTVTITVNHFTQFGILGATATALPNAGA